MVFIYFIIRLFYECISSILWLWIVEDVPFYLLNVQFNNSVHWFLECKVAHYKSKGSGVQY